MNFIICFCVFILMLGLTVKHKGGLMIDANDSVSCSILQISTQNFGDLTF